MSMMISSKNPPTPAPTTAGRRVKPPPSLVDRGAFAGTLRMGAFEWVEVVFITGVVREGVIDTGEGSVLLKVVLDPETERSKGSVICMPLWRILLLPILQLSPEYPLLQIHSPGRSQ